MPNSRGEEVSVQAKDGVILRAWWFAPAKPDGQCTVVLHGIADSRSGAVGFAPMFLSRGDSVLVPDCRAHCTSGGELVTYGLLEKFDVLEWAHWMKRSGCTEVFGLGESLEGSVLIQAAALEPVFTAIVADCPFTTLISIARYRAAQISQLPGWIARPAAVTVVAAAQFYARQRYSLDLGDVSPLISMATFESRF